MSARLALSSRPLAVSADHERLDLDKHVWEGERGDSEQSLCWPVPGHEFRHHPPVRRTVLGAHEVGGQLHDVIERRAGLAEYSLQVLEREPSLRFFGYRDAL